MESKKIVAIFSFSLLIITVFFSGVLSAQPGKTLWSDITETSITQNQNRQIVPIQYRTVTFDLAALITVLKQAPMEGSVKVSLSQFIITLPMPDGKSEQFRVVESPIMETGLMIKYPQMRTYLGQGIDNKTAGVRFDVTPAGFHAMILSQGPTVYIDPYSKGNTHDYISYYTYNLIYDESRRFDEIGIDDPNGESQSEISRIIANGTAGKIGDKLRTYRLALAADGEYTTYHGGTVAAGLAAMVTAMNRVDEVYERELCIRMILVSNTDLLIYTNANTDPYTNNSGSTMLGQNQTTIDNIIGTANYDIGHVFSTGGGGIAGLGVVCRSGRKANGVTGLSAPIGDAFYIDYVAHEMGHEFGGNHPFNGSTGSCSGGNRNGSTAYEPGSGTTIMAYAGICAPQDLQLHSDDYFHGISLDEISAYTTTGSGSGCPVITLTGNSAPVVDAIQGGFTIPLNTSFKLSGTANDPNGDSLTFCWEEFDLGPAGDPNSPSGNAVIFRSFKGTSDRSRIFPKLSDILNNAHTIGEILPTYARTLNFRLTARDNRPDGGGFGKSSTSVVVNGNAGPFTITSPNTSLSWLFNSVDTIRWNVANTDVAPINCSMVNIFLSTDGGQSFPISIAESTANDGIETFTAPNTLTYAARIKIESVGNIFFDISNVNFAIAPLASPALVSPANNAVNIPVPALMQWNGLSGAQAYRLQISKDVNFSNIVYDDSTLTDTAKSVSGLSKNVNHFWRIKAINNEGASGWSETWKFKTLQAAPATPTLQLPANNAIAQSPTILLKWNSVLFTTTYRLEVATDSTFAAIIVNDSTITATQKQETLSVGTKYYWRVRATNIGGTSAPSTVWNFTTQAASSVTDGSQIPERFELLQNYPNPFNPSTMIRFTLPTEATVTMTVYNALGERVTTLVNNVAHPAGFYEVVWDTKNNNGAVNASGIYFCRIDAVPRNGSTPFTHINKMMLLK